MPSSTSLFQPQIPMTKSSSPMTLPLNTTVLEASLESTGEVVESDAMTQLKRSMKSKSEMALKVMLETKVKVEMRVFQTLPIEIKNLSSSAISHSLSQSSTPP
ncbi:YLS9 protein [Spatholobus suberectus]|nr:YLS9 protein [Spatholobus suberectus]